MRVLLTSNLRMDQVKMQICQSKDHKVVNFYGNCNVFVNVTNNDIVKSNETLTMKMNVKVNKKKRLYDLYANLCLHIGDFFIF